jgi:hypothetical protein
MHQQSELLEVYRAVLHELELAITREAKHHDPTAYYLLRSIPGVGPRNAVSVRETSWRPSTVKRKRSRSSHRSSAAPPPLSSS